MASVDHDGDSDALRMVSMSRAEALRLLAGASYGRVAFSRDALPAIVPVNHLVELDGSVIIRTRLTSAMQADPEIVVAY